MSHANQPPDLSIPEAVDLFIRRKRPDWRGKTEETYRTNLGDFEDYARGAGIDSLENLTRWGVGAYTDWLLDQDYARATVASRQKHARTWLKFLEGQGLVETGLHLAIEVIRLDDDEASSEKQLEPKRAQNLISFYRESTKWRGTRRHALLEVFWHVGGRLSCVRALDLGDYDASRGVLKFRNRPETGTRLKRGADHERNAALSPAPKSVLDLFVARERLEVRDEHGREPLFASQQGRPTPDTIRFWLYEATQPCMAGECPHGRRRPNCDWVPRNQSSKCPSTRAPHHARRGSITWQRNLGFSRDVVAERAATTPDVIRRYYDKPDFDDELERRRHQTEQIDIAEHLNPSDLDDGENGEEEPAADGADKGPEEGADD